MAGKTKNKLTFSKKKAGSIKKKTHPAPSVPPSSAPPTPSPAPPPSTQPAPVQPQATPVAPAHQPPPPAADETYAAQPTEHASQIPTAQPAGTPPPAAPSFEPAAAPPEIAPMTMESFKTSTEMPFSSQSPSKKPQLKGHLVSQLKQEPETPANFKETEDLKEQVGNYLEICDSCLNGEFEPTDIIDLVHVLVMSLNLDVVSMALVDPERNGRLRQVVSRGYDIPPTTHVVECWEMALTAKGELLWDKLMNIATDKKTELAYWIIKENLDSVGYVPIRDGNNLYGFLFVASKTQKEPSILKSELLDACGSRLGITYSELYR